MSVPVDEGTVVCVHINFMVEIFNHENMSVVYCNPMLAVEIYRTPECYEVCQDGEVVHQCVPMGQACLLFSGDGFDIVEHPQGLLAVHDYEGDTVIGFE